MKGSKKSATKSTETVVHHAHAAAPKATGAKRGRKPGSKNAVKGTAGNSQVATQRTDGQGVFLMSQARENLNTLSSLKQQFSDIPSIRTEVEAHLEVLTNLREEIFPKKIAKAETQATAQSNGTTAAAPQFQQTVPMPPSVPVIPTTH
jgi:hypothetical protein